MFQSTVLQWVVTIHPTETVCKHSTYLLIYIIDIWTISYSHNFIDKKRPSAFFI